MAMSKIEYLLDKQEIMELSYRYSRACDRLDAALMTAVYWPDGTDDHGSFKGTAPDYVEWVMGFVGAWVSTHHDNGNILIDLDGDVAFGEVHWTGYYRYEIDGVLHDHLAAGRYLDRYERRNNRQGKEWRIKHRTCLSDWSKIEPANAAMHEAGQANPLRGRRGAEDHLYNLRNIAILEDAAE
jgi:hypothetical protein